MATLYIAEYAEQVLDLRGLHVLVPKEPPLAEQTVSIGSTTAASSAFNKNTAFVRIHTDAICSIAFGTGPSATTSNKRLAANTTEFFGVTPGASMKVAVITNT